MSSGCRGSAWPEPLPTICPQAAANGRCSATFLPTSPVSATALPTISTDLSMIKTQVGASGSRRPRKSLGQHFLTDTRIAARIVDAAALDADDTVVEVGPGRGVLTRRLVEAAGRVIAVELDPSLAAELPGRLGEPHNLTVVHGDARAIDLSGFTAPDRLRDGSWKVVANLPYYAASPIVRRFLESDPHPALMVVMVQREVAEAMCASPGSMSLLSVATQFYAVATVVTQVPAPVLPARAQGCIHGGQVDTAGRSPGGGRRHRGVFRPGAFRLRRPSKNAA